MTKAAMTASRRNGFAVAVTTGRFVTPDPIIKEGVHTLKKMRHPGTFVNLSVKGSSGGADYRPFRVDRVFKALPGMVAAVSNYRLARPF